MKKLLAILVACLMPICLIAGSGDVNNDGKIDVSDIVELLNHLNGNPTKNYTASEADVNNDGVVDNNDAKALATIILSSEPILVSGQIQIENDKLKSKLDNSVVCAVSDESDINNGQFEIEVNQTDFVQTFFVTQEDKIYMISRQPVNDGRDVVFSIESTAIGFASLHPILSSLTKDDFNILVSKIKKSSYYPSFYSEIEKLINNNVDLFDENNSALFNAFNLLFDDVFKDFVQSDNQDYDLVNGTISKTRAMEHPESFFPLHVHSYGNILKVSTKGLFPSYYGTITTSNGLVYNFNVLAADDWGLKEFLTPDARYGAPSEFVFINEGEYHFDFSRINAEATYDFWYRIVRLALSSLGVPVAKLNSMQSQLIGQMVNSISSALGATIDNNLSPGEMFRIVLTTCCDILENDFYLVNLAERREYKRLLLFINIRNYTRILSKVIGGYGIVHAATNALHRIFSANQAPEEIKFCLCYYAGEVFDCVEPKLFLSSGNNQEGNPNERLSKPLKVYVQAKDKNDYFHKLSPFMKVVFNVEKGGGRVLSECVIPNDDGTAETYWTLGSSGDQVVSAVVWNFINDGPVSNYIYFNASLLKDEDEDGEDEDKDEDGEDDITYYKICPDGFHPHWIDLGLPSGTQWRCCNEGASTPEGYGGYYEFGQVASAPSLDQIKDLLNHTTSVWTTQNGVDGRKFTGSNGGTIFLPAAGGILWTAVFFSVGSYGVYWSSTPRGEYYANGLYFYSGYASWDYYYDRKGGRPVRPVR